MLEAARLLRFTGLGVGEVAHRSGFTDPLYFSRAFKRHTGERADAYRGRARGIVHGLVRFRHGDGGPRRAPSWMT